MRRAVRRRQLGYPDDAEGEICGRTGRYWLNLFFMCHSRQAGGWLRTEWPDGGPVLAQSWPLTQMFQLIADELARIALTEHRRKKPSGPWQNAASPGWT